MISPLVLLLALTTTPPPEVYFSPHGGCTDAIVAEIAKAKHSVRVMAYVFTSKPILDALNEATARKVDVATVIDGPQEHAKGELGAMLRSPVAYDYMHRIAHNKIVIIDESVVITGSFNFTRTAEEDNAENMLVIRSKDLAAKYRANWELHRKHSRGPVPIAL